MKCLLPYSSLYSLPSGKLAPCCAANKCTTHIRDVNSLEGYLAEDKETLAIQDRFNRGEFPMEYCHGCKKRLDQNLEPYMVRGNKRLKRFASEDEILSGKDILFLELGFGRLCNQSCATCGSEKSSKWLQMDQRAAKIEILKFRTSDDFFDISDEIPLQMADDDFDKFTAIIPKLRTLTITGGEPLINPKCIEFLEKLRALNPDIDLNVITNFSMDNSDIINTLNHFKNLILTVSIDGKDELHKWIRGTSIEPTLQNIDRFKSTTGRNVFISTTISNYNFLRTPEIVNFLVDLKPANIKLTPVVGPAYCSPYLISETYFESVKRDFEEVLKRVHSTQISFNDCNLFNNSIYSRDSQTLSEARQWIDFMNQERKQSIYELVPELELAMS